MSPSDARPSSRQAGFNMRPRNDDVKPGSTTYCVFVLGHSHMWMPVEKTVPGENARKTLVGVRTGRQVGASGEVLRDRGRVASARPLATSRCVRTWRAGGRLSTPPDVQWRGVWKVVCPPAERWRNEVALLLSNGNASSDSHGNGLNLRGCVGAVDALCHTPERLCCTVGNKRPTGVDTRPGPRPRRRSSSASHASVPRWRSVQYARVHVPTRAQRYVAAHRQRSEFRTWNVERLICRTAGRPGRPPCRRGCSRRRGSGRGAPLLPAWRSAWRCRTGSGRRRSAPGSSPGSGRSAPD